jgi:hypothetical protein
MTPLQTMLNAILSLGVTIVGPTDSRAICPPGRIATYQFSMNHISLCENPIAVQHIIHEAIHVAQDCNANGLETPELKVLFPRTNPFTNPRFPSDKLVPKIQRLYSSEHHGWEYEAFYLEDKLSPREVTELLTTYCQP